MTLFSVELRGPDFVREASALLSKLKFNSVKELRVILGHASAASPNVKAAVRLLKPYLHSGAAVLLVTEGAAIPLPSTPSKQSAPEPSRPWGQRVVYLIAKEYLEILKIHRIQEDMQVKMAKIQEDFTVEKQLSRYKTDMAQLESYLGG
jgi:hypothetical protein